MKQKLDLNLSRSYTTCDNNKSCFFHPKPMALTSSYEEKPSQASNATVKVDFIDIKLPKNAPHGGDLTTSPRNVEDSAFYFERERLQALGLENIAKFQEDGPAAEVDLCDPKVVKFQAECKQQLEKDRGDVQKWSFFLRVLSIGAGCIEIASAAVSLLFIFILAVRTSVNIVSSSAPLMLNIAGNMWMLNVAIKIGRLSSLAVIDAGKFKKLFVTTGVSAGVFLLQFIIMAGIKSTPEILEKLSNLYVEDTDPHAEAKRGEAYVGLVYLLVWFFSMFNFAVAALGFVFGYLLRYSLIKQEIHQLKHNALPLGYLMHSKSHNQQSTAPEINKV